MQQRFCVCGHTVWVEYRFKNLGCWYRFWSPRYGRNVLLTRCPLCGKKIDIDELS
jgi:hypothetical protein